MADFNDITKDAITDKLEEYIGTKMYAGDMAYVLLEQYNADGTFTYSSEESKQIIKDNFEDFGELVDDMEANGLQVYNPFTESEAFVVSCLIENANIMLCGSKSWNELNNGGNEFELTEEIAKAIASEI